MYARRLRFLLLSMLILGLLLPTNRARAAGTVGTGTPETCTESALNSALTGGGAITFNCGAGPAVILLTSEKFIGQNTTIDGGGKIILTGGGSTRLFNVASGISLGLSNLTLADGSAGQGGAIYNNANGQVTITNATLYGNQAPGGVGGAIYNRGSLTLTADTISSNVASAGLSGAVDNGPGSTLTISKSVFSGNFGGLSTGAIGNGGTLTVTDTQFLDNHGGAAGAIYNFGSATFSGCTFSGNGASSGFGGGIYNNGTLTVRTSTFSTNAAGAGSGGGAIYNSGGTVSVSSSTLSSNTAQSGGGIYNDLASGLTVTASTLSTNTAVGGFGGGIYNKGSLVVTADTFSGNGAAAGLGGGINNDVAGTVTVTNSTFSGNFGGLSGGGMITGGTATVTNSTFYNNSAGGLINGGTSTVSVKNTIVAGNSPDCFGTLTSLSHNLADDSSCSFTAAGDLQNTNPKLGALANNGGPTMTQALLASSPAIDAGTASGCPGKDQRGVSRPQGGKCDIGAYEVKALSFVSAGAYDGWLLESSRGSGVGGSLDSTAATLLVGDDASNRQYRSLLSFSTAALPDGATLVLARIKLKKASLTGTNPFATHGSLLIGLRKPYFGSELGLVASDFQAAVTVSPAGTIGSGLSGGFYTGFLNSTGLSKISKTGTTQLRLRFKLSANNDNGADFLSLYSGNAAPASNRPVLVVYYNP